MTLIVNDRVQEVSTSTGSGPFVLGGGVTGYQTFSVGIGDTNSTYYTITNGTNWMDILGTYTSAANSITVDKILTSSAGGTTAVSFAAGTKNIFCTYPAATAVLAAPATYPTIQPSLNLDFANTKLLDPRITFVRNSTAAYYDGQTSALAEQNLLLQSNTFSNAAWVATNGTVVSGITDPAGTTTAFSFTATGVATLYQTLTTTATPYTLSFYIQRVIGTGAVNLTLDGTTLTPQTITGSWARYSVTATPTAASHTIGIQLAVITDSVNIFSSQLENRSSMTAANITTTSAITNYILVLMTAPAGVARFDCDPITGKSLGLLLEESRTNLLLYSATFSNAAWTLTNATLTAAATIAPDGTQTAFNLVSNTSTGLQAIAQTVTKAASALAYTSTVHFKANQYTYSWLQISDGAGNGAIVYFNLTTGAISTAVAGVGTAFTALFATTPTSIGNGWYRCNITGTSNTATSLVTQFGSSTNGTSNSVVGDGYSGVFIWGAQLEAGSFATSLIPTVASTVTRAADQASMTGTNFSSWYNQAQGTVYAQLTSDVPDNNTGTGVYYQNSIASFNVIVNTGFGLNVSNTSSRVFRLGFASRFTSSLTAFVDTPDNAVPQYVESKVIGAYTAATSTVSLTSNGNAVVTGTVALPAGAVTFGIMSSLSGHIKKLSYYPVALSSSNLVALTS